MISQQVPLSTLLSNRPWHIELYHIALDFRSTHELLCCLHLRRPANIFQGSRCDHNLKIRGLCKLEAFLRLAHTFLRRLTDSRFLAQDIQTILPKPRKWSEHPSSRICNLIPCFSIVSRSVFFVQLIPIPRYPFPVVFTLFLDGTVHTCSYALMVSASSRNWSEPTDGDFERLFTDLVNKKSYVHFLLTIQLHILHKQ
jgi:hypothetical protein